MAYSDFTPAGQRLKKAWHEATFMRGQTTPAAKHLFDAIENALQHMKRR